MAGKTVTRTRTGAAQLALADAIADALPTAPPCRVEDADTWFSEGTLAVQWAKRQCGGCPVRTECLAAALERGEKYGVWGGEEFPLKKALT